MAKTQDYEIKRIYRRLSLGPELRDEPPKNIYPKGRVKQVFDVYKAELNSLMRVNLYFLLFFMPLLLVVLWFAQFEVAKVISQFNFMGNIGIGYPGGSDSAIQGLISVYDAYQVILYIVLPCMTVLGLGAAGAFNCYKKYMWGETVKSVTKTFFRGIKKFWYKYLIVFTFDGLLVLGEGSLIIYFLKMKALGQDTAGIWAMLFLVSIAVFVVSYINLNLLPMLCTINLPLHKQIKNSVILSYKFGIVGLPIWLLCLLPLCLFFLKSNFLTLLLYMLFLMFGLILYGLTFTGFGQYTFDIVMTPLYEHSINQTKNEEKKKKKKKKKSNKKHGGK